MRYLFSSKGIIDAKYTCEACEEDARGIAIPVLECRNYKTIGISEAENLKAQKEHNIPQYWRCLMLN